MSERAAKILAGVLYRVAHAIYDFARRLDRYSNGTPWRHS
jgi:hypothetical protein